MSVVAKRLDGSRCQLVRRYPRSRPYCVRWGSISPERGTAPLLYSFLSMSIVVKRWPISAAAEHLYHLRW